MIPGIGASHMITVGHCTMGIIAFRAAVLICNMQVLPWRLLRSAVTAGIREGTEEKT